MLHNDIVKLLNRQVNEELVSSYIYMNIFNYYDSVNLDGFANWYMIQTKEEYDHAMLFYKYLHNNNETVIFEDIKKPPHDFKSSMDPLKLTLNHEMYITSLINKIYEKAQDIKDFRTMQFLDWFIKEQGEEELNSQSLISKMEIFGKDTKGLYELNKELLARRYTAPSLII